MLSKTVGLVHLNVFVYALRFWICHPVLPFLSKELGADPLTFGYLQTTFSIFQLFGGPLMGRVCDAMGSRLALQISQAGSAVHYFMLGSSGGLPMLFASQAPTLFQHAMHAAQAAIVTLESDKDARAKALGRLSLSYGIGMVVGGPLGGFLSNKFGYSMVAYVASGVSAALLVLNQMGLPVLTVVATEDKKPAEGGLNAKRALAMLGNPALRNLLLVAFLVGSAFSVQRSTFSVVMMDKFEMDASDIGWVLSYGGAVHVLNNSFLVGPVVEKLGEYRAMVASITLAAVCFAVYTLATSFSIVIAIMFPLGIGSSMMYTLLSAFVTRVTPEGESGTAIGLSHATRTACGILAPTAGSYVYQRYGFSSLGVVCAGLAGSGVFIMLAAFAGSQAILESKKKKIK